MEELLELVGFFVGLFVLLGFFNLVSRVGTIRKGVEALERQAAEQTRYLAAISANIARRVRESSPSNADAPKS
jgi:uncharacterized ion transporter superfamily protein YfcC